MLEQYLYSLPNLTPDHDDWEHPSGWILASDIKCQFDAQDNHSVRHLAGRVIELAKFVQNNLDRFEPDLYGLEGESVSEAWAILEQTVRRCQDPPSSTNV